MENVEKFSATITELAELYARKNHDYGDSFGRIARELNENMGEAAKMGYMLGHIKEKAERAMTVALHGTQVGEPLKDSLRDLACYAIMAYNEL